jgi:hypothetical protein
MTEEALIAIHESGHAVVACLLGHLLSVSTDGCRTRYRRGDRAAGHCV